MTESVLQYEIIDEEILIQAMSVQLVKWKETVASGSKRVGWKLGFTPLADQQRMKLPYPIVGFLTSDSVLSSGDSYTAGAAAKVMLEAEVAILISRNVSANESAEQLKDAIEGFAPAIEIVDVTKSAHDITSILENNVFHERVIIGGLCKNYPDLLAAQVNASVTVNQQLVQTDDSSRYPDDFTEVVSVVANTLAKQGECLQADDWIICGSITVPVQVHPGDSVEVSLAPLGTLTTLIE